MENSMDQSQIDEAEWQDRRNWHGGWLGIYRSQRDTRVWVPKRNPKMGWTINTARPAGLVLVIGIPLLAVALARLARTAT
jgi:uncharacterized membrane protein